MTAARPALRRRRLLRAAGAIAVTSFHARPSRAAGSLSKILAVRPQNGPPRQSEPNTTLSTLYNLESAPAWVRLNYLAKNMPYTVDGAAIALTSAVHDGFTPVNNTGQPDDTLWKIVSFNHDGDASAPGPVSPRPVRSLRVPARQVSTIGYSDWVPVEPLPRSDGGAGALLLTRTWSRDVFRTSSALVQEWPDKEINRDFAVFRSAGNGTAAPWSFAGERDTLTACYGVQYVSAQPGITMIGVGDSIMLPPASIPFGMRACALLSTPVLPVSYVNEGYVGRRSVDYLAAGAASIAALQPQVALIQTYTGNDPSTRSATDAAFDGALQLAAMVARRRCLPVLVGPAPAPQVDAATEALRQDSLQRTRAMAAKGFLVLDLDRLWGVGQSPNNWQPGYAMDRWHPSNAGSRVAAEALATMLRAAWKQ